MRNTEALKSQELRFAILQILKSQYPENMSRNILVGELKELGFDITQQEMVANLNYINSKGYATLHPIEHAGISRLLVKITVKGIDLLEGNIPNDPGVKENA